MAPPYLFGEVSASHGAKSAHGRVGVNELPAGFAGPSGAGRRGGRSEWEFLCFGSHAYCGATHTEERKYADAQANGNSLIIWFRGGLFGAGRSLTSAAPYGKEIREFRKATNEELPPPGPRHRLPQPVAAAPVLPAMVVARNNVPSCAPVNPKQPGVLRPNVALG